VRGILDDFKREPERAQRLGQRNAIEAIRRFDWSYRWSDILRLTDLPPLPALVDRRQRLADLAAAAETTLPRGPGEAIGLR